MKILKLFGGVLVAILLVILAAFLALHRGDIPYAELEKRYAQPTSHYLDLPNGVHLHYRDEGKADGPVLVLVHGFGASAADWDDWAARLGDTYHIIAPDLPGHGLTRAPKGYQNSGDGQVGVVEAMASALKLPPFVIAGNSMGGGVAWRYTLAHPERVTGLVLVDAAGWPPLKAQKQGVLIFTLLGSPPVRAVIKNLDTTALVRQGMQSAFINKDLVTPALVRRYTDFSRAPGHREILTTRPSGMAANPAPLLANIAAPTLIMVGAEDHVIPAADGQRFKDAIPDSTLIVYPGVGHAPMEQIPDQSAADLRAWLAKVDNPATQAALGKAITVRELPPAHPGAR